METDIHAILREYADAWSAQDAERICTLFVEDCFFEDVAFAASASGLDELRGFLAATFRSVPDFRMELDRIHAGSNFAVVEWTQSGTGVADFGEVQTKRGPFSERAASVIEFRGDKIVRVSDYWNVSRILE